MARIQAACVSTFAAQRTARCARAMEPGTDLNRPGLPPLPRSAPGEREFGLGEGNVLAKLQADAAGAPFGCVGFVVGMAGDANYPVEEIVTTAGEIILQHLVTLAPVG